MLAVVALTPKVTLAASAGMVTVDGSEIAGSLADRVTTSGLPRSLLLRVSVALAVPGTWVDNTSAESVSDRVWPSTLVTSICAAADPWLSGCNAGLASDAVTVIVSVFASVAVLMVLIGKVTEVAPAGTTTSDGALSVALSLELRRTITACCCTRSMVTVAIAEGLGAFPGNMVAPRFRLNCGKSSSRTLRVDEPVTNPGADALMATRYGPSGSRSFTASMLKVADLCPAGIVTVSGTVALYG